MGDATIGFAGLDQIKDPELSRFIERVTDLMKLEVLHTLTAKATPTVSGLRPQPLMVGVKERKAYASVGKVVSDWIDKKPAETKANMLKRATSGAALTPALKTFGRELGFDVKSAKYGLDQIDARTHFGFMNANFMTKLMTSVKGHLDFLGHVGAPPAAAPIVINKGLKLFCDRIKCIDETDPEFFGDDEISCGGVAIDDKEKTTNIPAFTVGTFKDGVTKNYSPDRLLKSFEISGSEYPKTYAAFIALAEKDNGGFSDFLEELFGAVKAEVTIILGALGAVAGAEIAAAIGGTLGATLGGPIGVIIGIAAGLALAALVSWIASALEDDVFEPQVTTVTFAGPASDFGGSLTSPTMKFTYRDFGGKYALSYYWKIVR